LGQSRGGKKKRIFGQGGCGFGSSQNGFNGLILNWCIGGCWFTPASKAKAFASEE